MTTFYVCRHGETENNKNERLSGWIDTPLTENGLRNIQSTATKLQAIQFDDVESSDLGRAFITAYLVTRSLGFTSEIHRKKELRETNYGEYANMPWSEVMVKCPDLLRDTDFLPPHGESLGQMQQRVLACMYGLSKEYPSQTVLVVCHDGTINALYAHLMGIDLAELMKTRVNAHDFVARIVITNDEIASFDEV